MNNLLLFSGNSNRPLAEKIASYLNIGLGEIIVRRFPDGEIDVRILENVRGADVFIIQSTCPPVNENLMELLLMIDCVKRASAERITAVIPYFGYARQDRKMEGRVPISAKLVANLITASGTDRVLTIDLHASQIQGFFDIPLDHLFASAAIIDYLKNLNIPELVIVSPDLGGLKMASAYAKRLNASVAIIDKRRESPTSTEVMHLIGEVEGKSCLLVDDIISTGTSIVNAARFCRQKGAARIYLCAVHPVLVPQSIDKINDLRPDAVIVTDTIPADDRNIKNLHIVSVASLVGEAINRIHTGKSVSALFV